MSVGLVQRASEVLAARTGRRGFLVRTAIVGSAVVTAPQFIVRPMSAYAAVCTCRGNACGCGSACCDGYTELCCSIYGTNTCPSGTALGGWWRAAGQSFCNGNNRFYLDCNTLPGSEGICGCTCAGGDCNRRVTCCTHFRYGQCHQEIPQMGAIVCRVVTCTPPWQLDSTCTGTDAIDESTAFHDAPCLHQPPPPPPQENDMPTPVVRRLVVNPADATMGYVLDARGGIHPFGGAKPCSNNPYWSEGAAMDLVIVDWSKPSGYVLDCKGAVHAFGGLTQPLDAPYWQNAFVPPTPPT